MVSSVSWLALADGGSRMVTAGMDGALVVWDAPGGDGALDGPLAVQSAAAHPASLPGALHLPQVWGVAWAPDGAALASTGEDGAVRVQPVVEGQLQEPAWAVPSGNATSGVAWTGDGALLASGSRDGAVRVWLRGKGRGAELSLAAVLEGHTAPVMAVAWSPAVDSDGTRWLASGGDDTTVRVWTLNSGGAAAGRAQVLAQGDGRALAWVTSLAWAPRGDLLAVGGQSEAVTVWQLLPGGGGQLDASSPQQLLGHATGVLAVAWAPGERKVLPPTARRLSHP